MELYLWLIAHYSLLAMYGKRSTAEQNVSYPDYLLNFSRPIPPLSQPGKWLPYNLKSSKTFVWENTWTYDYLEVTCISVYHISVKWLGERKVESGKSLSVRCTDREDLGLFSSSNSSGLCLDHGGSYYLMMTGAEGSCSHKEYCEVKRFPFYR